MGSFIVDGCFELFSLTISEAQHIKTAFTPFDFMFDHFYQSFSLNSIDCLLNCSLLSTRFSSVNFELLSCEMCALQRLSWQIDLMGRKTTWRSIWSKELISICHTFIIRRNRFIPINFQSLRFANRCGTIHNSGHFWEQIKQTSCAFKYVSVIIKMIVVSQLLLSSCLRVK